MSVFFCYLSVSLTHSLTRFPFFLLFSNNFILWFYSNDTENSVIRLSLPFSLFIYFVTSHVLSFALYLTQTTRAKVDVKLCICSWHTHTQQNSIQSEYLFCVTKHKLFLQLLTTRNYASSFGSISVSVFILRFLCLSFFLLFLLLIFPLLSFGNFFMPHLQHFRPLYKTWAKFRQCNKTTYF